MKRGGKKVDPNEIEAWIKEFDISNNGKLNFEEFQKMMEKE